MPDWRALISQIGAHGIGTAIDHTPSPVAGGDINAAWRLRTENGDVFLKTARAEALDMFSAEAHGLEELQRANAVRVPSVLGFGATEDDAYLALEWLDFAPASNNEQELLGRQLAAQHRVTAERHGWQRDNTIGLTPQPNTWTDNWTAFFREHRLMHQLRIAEQNGFRGELQTEGARLADGLERLLADHTPEASLLHGDLWGGNWAAVDGHPVMFDPAVYYGDREADLAMTRLFGGFGRRFYDAYEESWPLPPGNEQRCNVYQLYHVLNHLNLFGTAYLGRSMQLIRSLL